MERFVILRESDIGIAVVGVRARARLLGFSAPQLDRLATAVSELARNIVKYSRTSGGDILLRDEIHNNRLRLVLQARDNGPGIDDVEQALCDHYSSSGTLGLGLPGVRRLMDSLSIQTVPGAGTVVTATLER